MVKIYDGDEVFNARVRVFSKKLDLLYERYLKDLAIVKGVSSGGALNLQQSIEHLRRHYAKKRNKLYSQYTDVTDKLIVENTNLY